MFSPEDDSVDLQWLLELNHRENPQGVGHFEELIASGYDLDDILPLCDEMGHLRYQDRKDPDALVNRVFFFDTRDRRTIPPKPRPRLYFPKSKPTLYDKEAYAPSIPNIQGTRALISLSVESALQKSLESHKDYLEYFGRFHPEVFRQILRNLQAIELTEGCNGPCRSICALPVQSRAKRHIPFETVEWLFRNFPDELRSGERRIQLYHSSDLVDYDWNGKTAVDIINLYEKYLRRKPYISTVFRLDTAAVDLLLELIVQGKHIDRISRLVTGQDPKDFHRLIEKLQNRARERGYRLDENAIHRLAAAFFQGEKDGMNLTVGNAVSKETPERDISPKQITCFHGVIFLAGRGFFSHVMRPHSKRFPHGSIVFPLHPNQEKFFIPQALHLDECFAPFGNRERLVLGPKYIIMDARGNLQAREERNREEKILIALSHLKQAFNRIALSTYTGNPATGKSERIFRLLVEDLKKEACRNNPEDNMEKLRFIPRSIPVLQGWMDRFFAEIERIYETFGNDPTVLHECLELGLGFINFLQEEMGLIRQYITLLTKNLEALRAAGKLTTAQEEEIAQREPQNLKLLQHLSEKIDGREQTVLELQTRGGEEFVTFSHHIDRQRKAQNIKESLRALLA